MTAAIAANTSSTKSPPADESSSDESSSDDDSSNEAAAKKKRRKPQAPPGCPSRHPPRRPRLSCRCFSPPRQPRALHHPSSPQRSPWRFLSEILRALRRSKSRFLWPSIRQTRGLANQPRTVSPPPPISALGALVISQQYTHTPARCTLAQFDVYKVNKKTKALFEACPIDDDEGLAVQLAGHTSKDPVAFFATCL